MPQPPKLTCVLSFQIEEPQKKSGAGASTVVARVRGPRSWLWQEGCYDVYPPFFSTGSKPLARVRLCCTSPTKTRVTSTYTKKNAYYLCLPVCRAFFLPFGHGPSHFHVGAAAPAAAGSFPSTAVRTGTLSKLQHVCPCFRSLPRETLLRSNFRTFYLSSLPTTSAPSILRHTNTPGEFKTPQPPSPGSPVIKTVPFFFLSTMPTLQCSIHLRTQTSRGNTK